MKHKRQTLSKQGEDGDEKEGSGKPKSEKGLLLHDENSKKSCQSCELPPGMLGDHLASRNNNNNNTSFNNNSNASSGASSVTSTASSFEKLEDDSRSNESRVLTSPGLMGKRPGEVVVKTEGLSLCSSPGKKIAKESRLISPDVAAKALTPASTPGTPLGPQASPLEIPGPYSRPRGSPTAATAVATATASVTTILPNSPVVNPSLVQIVRCTAPNSFPSPQRHDYRQQYRQNYPREYAQRYPDYRQQSPRPNGMHAARQRGFNQYQYQNMYNGYGQEYNYQRQYSYEEYQNYSYHYEQQQQQQQQQQPQDYYQENYQEYTKAGQAAGYYENQMGHQGGEASAVPNHYISSPDPFPVNAPSGTSLMTPPNSVRTESSDHYTSFHHFYGEQQQHQQSENSNSSSDFNFLTNLANDFAPEYYQLS